MVVINLADKKEYEIEVRKSGENAMPCPVCSHTRQKKSDKCFSFNLQKGAGKCNHCGVVLVEKKEMPAKPEKEYVRPQWKNNTALSDEIVKWFASRKISQRTLIEMNITQGTEFMPQIGKKTGVIEFNYFRDGELINTKFRTRDKHFKMVKDAELILYNIDAAINHEEIIIVEGEMDALALFECGFKNVVSVPNGANLKRNNLVYLDNCIDRFSQNTAFILALDNDPAGLNLRDELARRFGPENCFKVQFKDCKDANDCLIKYGESAIQECIKEKREFPIKGVFTAADIDHEVMHYYEHGLPPGCGIGVGDFDGLLKFHPGYITTITGIPGHGKSEVLDFICARLNLMHDWKFALFSPENHPLELHFSKLAEKFIGKPFEGMSRMNLLELNGFKRYFNDNFYFIKPEEDFTLDTILATAKALVRKKGIKGLVIDAWNKIDHLYVGNETQYISRELDKITRFSEMNGVHTFLVAHPTKVQKDKQTGMFEVPNLYSISGSANFFNKTANGISVYRNMAGHCTEVYVQKVKFKHWGGVGKATLFWERSNGRYYSIVPDFNNWLEQQNEQITMENNVDFLTEEKHDNVKDWPF